MSETVLLTGVSGYVGLHAAKLLLEAGFAVRGSVRKKAKEKQVFDALRSASVDTSKLTIVELDLTSDVGWDAAARGADYVMHVASPFAVAAPKHEDEMIKPAVDGTLRALRAAKSAGVKRVVLTSSLLAMGGHIKRGTVKPSDWTDLNDPSVSAYTKSKTLAEKAAWDFVNTQDDTAPLELVAISPGAIFGPPVGSDLSGTSMSSVANMLRGKVPMVPQLAMPMVDVRDIARIHVEALTNPDAVGQRLIVADPTPRGFGDIAQILKDGGYKGPSTRVAPNFMIRFMALFDREAKGTVGYLGMNQTADVSLTRKIFNWSPIQFDTTILDTGKAIKSLQG